MPDLPDGQALSATLQTSRPSIELAGHNVLASSYLTSSASQGRAVKHCRGSNILENGGSSTPDSSREATEAPTPWDHRSVMNSRLSLMPEGE